MNVYWNNIKIGVLEYVDNFYIFQYTDGLKEANKLGFEYLGEFLDINKTYKDKDLFITFSIRIPSFKRKDFKEFLLKNGLSEFSNPLDILALTQGKLSIDKIYLKK